MNLTISLAINLAMNLNRSFKQLVLTGLAVLLAGCGGGGGGSTPPVAATPAPAPAVETLEYEVRTDFRIA